MKEKPKFKRPSKDQVKGAAKRAVSGGSWLSLPPDTTEWKPEKACEVELNIWPFIVKVDNHPDRAEKGQIWPRMLYSVHFGVGVDNTAIVCPRSVGRGDCPICQKRDVLAKDWKANEKAIKAITPQKWAIFNIENPDEPGEVAVFNFSRGKFAEPLDKELDIAKNEQHCLYFDTSTEGRTITVRFSKESYDGKKFFAADRFDFAEREALDEDEILSKVVQLDECLIVESYETIKAMFEAGAIEGSDEDDDEVEESPKRPSKSKSSKPVAEVEEGDDDEVEEATPEKSKKVVEEEDDDEAPPPPKKSKKAPNPEPDDEDLSDMEDMIEEPAPKSKKRAVVEEEDDDDEPAPPKKVSKKVVEEEDDDDDEPAPPKKSRKVVEEDDDE